MGSANRVAWIVDIRNGYRILVHLGGRFVAVGITHMYSEWTVFILLCGHGDSKKGGKFLYPSKFQRDYIPRCSCDTVPKSDATGRFKLGCPTSKIFSGAS